MEEFRTVALSDCYESPLNTRRHFDEGALKDLTESVASKGVLTPILVREREMGGGRFEILAGARRCRAAKAAGVDQIPARVFDFTDDEALEIVVIENLQRENVHPLEEAEGYKALLERPGYDVAAIAAKVGKTESYVYQRLKLAELVEPARNAFLEDRMTIGHAILIARLQPDDQLKALGRAFRDEWSSGASVKVAVRVPELARMIEEEILRDLKRAPFDPKDAALLSAAGACTVCPKRTGASPALFPDITKGDTCTDGTCFKAKVAAHLDQTAGAIAAKGAPPLRLSAEYSVQTRGKAGAKILASSKWRRAKAKECPHVQKGIIVDVSRYNEPQLGQVLTVCAETSCKVHHVSTSAGGHSLGGGFYGSAQAEARRRRENEKRARQVEINRRIFAAMAAAAPKKLGRVELERLAALGLPDDLYLDDDRLLLLAPLLGVEQSADSARGGAKRPSALATAIARIDDAALARFLAVLPLVECIDTYGDEGAADLRRVAKEYGVNVDAITRAAEAEFKAKDNEAKAAGKAKARAKTAGSAKGKRKKPAPTKTAKKAKKAKVA